MNKLLDNVFTLFNTHFYIMSIIDFLFLCLTFYTYDLVAQNHLVWIGILSGISMMFVAIITWILFLTMIYRTSIKVLNKN